MIKAVFLDRDGVICHRNYARSEERNAEIGRIIGDPAFTLTEQDEVRLFYRVFQDPNRPPIGSMETEEAFWRRWGEVLLEEHGMTDCADVSRDICSRYPFHTMLEAYHDAPSAIDEIRGLGCRLAVISNTFPSLEASVRSTGLGDRFEAFIASSLVGCSKPDPKIFRIALARLGVQACESIFVDDMAENADAARELGMLSFCLDRKRAAPDWEDWTIHSLSDLPDYIRRTDL